MIRTALQEPGAAGSYDAEISLAGFGFGPRYLLESFLEPTQDNWRQLLAAYHEWVHHFQFYATTYGYLYRLVSNNQLLLVNGALRLAKEDRQRLSLPLTTCMIPLSESPEHPNDLNLRVVSMLQSQRDGILGYGPHIAMSDLPEWRFACDAMGEMFGGPRTVVLDPSEMPTLPEIRYPTLDLLETHAHVLSSMWLTLAIDRLDGDRRIARKAVEYANEQVTGPYAAFTRFVPAIPGSPQDRIKVFCALSEIALNPPGIHRHPKQSRQAIIMPSYSSWFPVVRLESLMSLVLEKQITWPGASWPSSGRDFLRSVHEAMAEREPPGSFLPVAGSVAQPTLEDVVERVSRYAAIDGDVPPELLAFQLDALAKLCNAEELRQKVPLLLSGLIIEELPLLTEQVGGPTAICHDASGSSTLISACTGLKRLGLLSEGTMQAGSDAIVNLGAPIAHALHQLLLRSRSELEVTADKPMLGMKGWTLRTVLDEYYGMSLSDFD